MRKKIKLGYGICSPILLAPALMSASCLEQVNAILNNKRPGKKDEENTNTSTKPVTPEEKGTNETSTTPQSGDNSPKRTQLEMINDFNDVYTNSSMLDVAPAAFNDTGLLIAREIPRAIYDPDQSTQYKFMFKHPTTQLRYSGVKKFYDYALQADDFKENLHNRLLRLFDSKTHSFVSNGVVEDRLGFK
ncbi:UNVERIFIED_CONTAM: hypothetical protein O8I53_11545 [Campylobacter lari]